MCICNNVIVLRFIFSSDLYLCGEQTSDKRFGAVSEKFKIFVFVLCWYGGPALYNYEVTIDTAAGSLCRLKCHTAGYRAG